MQARAERAQTEPRASTSASPLERPNGTGTLADAHLPTPPHPEHLASPALAGANASAPSAATATAPLPLPTPERTSLPLVPPRAPMVEELGRGIKAEEQDPVLIPPPLVAVKLEAEDVDMPPAP